MIIALVADEECDCPPAELGGPIHLSLHYRASSASGRYIAVVFS